MKAVINDTDLYFIDSGDPSQKAIVFIHGFPFSHEMWNQQIDLLKKNYRVIAYDLRGHGSSGIGDGQYAFELFVDDLVGLLDHLKIGRAVLCGLSIGGYIVLRAVERSPERVEGLILCDTQSGADSNEAKLTGCLDQGGQDRWSECIRRRICEGGFRPTEHYCEN